MTPTKHDKPRKTKEEIINEAKTNLINSLIMQKHLLEQRVRKIENIPAGEDIQWDYFVKHAWNKACEDAIRSQETLVIHRQKNFIFSAKKTGS